jgi:hypothetical protein
MSIYPLLLEGWEDASTWGDDNGNLYAQLTRNGISDDDGPEIWITPPYYPAVHTVAELAHAIAQATACDRDAVLHGMTTGAAIAGASPAEQERLNLAGLTNPT